MFKFEYISLFFYSRVFNFLTPCWKVFCQLCTYNVRWYWLIRFGSSWLYFFHYYVLGGPSYWSVCTKSGKWAVMYCVLTILTLSVIFQLDLTVSANFTKSGGYHYHTCSLAVLAWHRNFNKKWRQCHTIPLKVKWSFRSISFV